MTSGSYKHSKIYDRIHEELALAVTCIVPSRVRVGCSSEVDIFGDNETKKRVARELQREKLALQIAPLQKLSMHGESEWDSINSWNGDWVYCVRNGSVNHINSAR